MTLGTFHIYAYDDLNRMDQVKAQSVLADYDGNSLDDFALFRPATGLWAVLGLTRLYFGSSRDLPATR